ncbi:hypothetical protein PRIPAC_89344 [Pristionchus pacificus]|uniref:Uncharacterized protein n=1 Tax=Pristionchus pacificus TaxID=54126 RepID=A0A2A6B414_PRIPA|nr:hypothetical protein PRIPAC_89344 [Pristionchus pacificus]|eukprot:PDM60601.1 hypothetical protein PRIPAC_53579 [Pristionchus pacificus]
MAGRPPPVVPDDLDPETRLMYEQYFIQRQTNRWSDRHGSVGMLLMANWQDILTNTPCCGLLPLMERQEVRKRICCCCTEENHSVDAIWHLMSERGGDANRLTDFTHDPLLDIALAAWPIGDLTFAPPGSSENKVMLGARSPYPREQHHYFTITNPTDARLSFLMTYTPETPAYPFIRFDQANGIIKPNESIRLGLHVRPLQNYIESRPPVTVKLEWVRAHWRMYGVVDRVRNQACKSFEFTIVFRQNVPYY